MFRLHKRKLLLCVPLLFAALSTAAHAQEQEKTLEGISVVGNNEDPRVLYLIPWQTPSISKKVEHEPTTELSGSVTLLNPDLVEQLMHFRATHQIKVSSLQHH